MRWMGRTRVLSGDVWDEGGGGAAYLVAKKRVREARGREDFIVGLLWVCYCFFVSFFFFIFERGGEGGLFFLVW